MGVLNWAHTRAHTLLWGSILPLPACEVPAQKLALPLEGEGGERYCVYYILGRTVA